MTKNGKTLLYLLYVGIGGAMSNKVVIAGVNTSTLPKLTSEEQYALMVKIAKGDKEARQQFAIANMRLVLSVCKKFHNRKESMDDIFQVGCVGLMKAIDNFDINLGVRFSTYAVPMIVGEIKRFLRDNNSIRVSRSLRDTAYKALKMREELIRCNEEEPKVEDIAKALSMEVREVAVALDAISDPLSLGDAVGSDEDESITLMDQVADETSNQDYLIEQLGLKEALKKLTGREKQIIMYRYYIGKTQMEVSEEIGISQAQVSRLEKTAIDEIRKSFF